MKFLKKNWWYLLVFIFIFCCLNFFGFNHNYGDPTNNYGFSYAIARGQIPYLDFNTVSTPLYAFYCAIFLLIYNNYVTFLLAQALLVTVTFYFLYQMFGKKASLFLVLMAVFTYSNIIGTYNYMCFFMMVVLVYLEKKYPNKDYLIGACIALSCLAKQTIGPFLIIPSIIFYHKDLKKLLRRFIGFLIPCIIFLIYLLVTGAFLPFLDLCFFGLFDFFNNNGVGGGQVHIWPFIFTLLSIVFSLILIIRHRKDIQNYYLFFGFLFAVPLFDFTHYAMYANCLLIMVLPYIQLPEKYLVSLSFAIFIPTCILLFIMWPVDFVFTSDANHFNYNLHDKKVYQNLMKYDKYIDQYEDAIVVGYYSMYYDIINDRDLSYFDVLYYGNFGYNGTEKMINHIKDMHDQYFVVSFEDYKSDYEYSQFAKEVAHWIVSNCEEVDTKYAFVVYYKE